MSEHVVCSVDDFDPEAAFATTLPRADGTDITVAVIRDVNGDYHAIADECSHGEVSLSEGDVDGCQIECWAHGARFDVVSGEAVELPAISPVASYPTRIDHGNVLVDPDNPRVSTKENV